MEEVRRGPGRPRKEDVAPAVMVRCIIDECWDSAGKHMRGEEFETPSADAAILIDKGQVERC
jgi:hypothetical protein